MSTTSERLRQALSLRNMKQSELSERTGIGKSSISTYLSGAYLPKQRNIYKMAQVLDVDEAWLMGLDVPMERSDTSAAIPKGFIPVPKTTKIPLVGTIACGVPILAGENIDGYVELPDNIRADFALRCKGDSMIGAGIRDGDIVYIHKQPAVENGQIAAVRVDDEATLKRFYQHGDTVQLVAENPSVHPLVFVQEEINSLHIVGLAVGYTHKILY